MKGTAMHWLKFDHATFLVAFILSIANLVVKSDTISILIFVFLLLAFLYDINEQRAGKEK